MRLHKLSVIGTILLAGCGGSVSGDNTGATGDETGVPSDDTGTPTADTGTTPTDDTTAPAEDTAAPADTGGPSETYPAFKPDQPMLQNNGGNVLTAPVIVTITFPGDTNAANYEDFGDKIGATDYWKQITAEYGISPAVSGASNHARMTDPLPATVNVTRGTDDLASWLTTHLADPAKYGLPVPTDNSIYVIYVDPKSKFLYQGTEICSSGVGGYHTSVKIGGKEVAYAILPQCDRGGGILSETTLSSSHEIAEATLDPNPQTSSPGPGWTDVDDAHLAWDFFMQFNVENGDLCEVYQDYAYRPTTEAGFTYSVQRQWSNASAKAGHNPCVPVTKVPYFNVSTIAPEDIVLDLSKFGSGKVKTKGYSIAVGESKTFQVGFYSDAKIDPWTLKSIEGGPFSTTKTHNLDITIDKTSGTNGEIANVTVKVLAAGKNGYELMAIVSTRGTGGTAVQHFEPIMISPP